MTYETVEASYIRVRRADHEPHTTFVCFIVRGVIIPIRDKPGDIHGLTFLNFRGRARKCESRHNQGTDRGEY